jgi:hypothetical protein
MNLQRPMTRGILIVAVVIVLCWGIFLSNVLAANVTATWSYDYRPEPACSASQSIACIDHFEVEDITNQGDFVVIRQVPNPSPAVGKVDRISTSFKYGPPFGQRTISVIAVGKDAKGQRVTSNPFAARVTVAIRPTVKMSVMF